MDSVRRRARHKAKLESGVSICILGILFLIGVGISIKQSNYDLSRFGMDAVSQPKFNIPFEPSSLVP